MKRICIIIYLGLFICVLGYMGVTSLIKPQEGYDVNSDDSDIVIELDGERDYIQTFFPLHSNVTEIAFYANNDETAQVVVWSNDTGVFYYDEIVDVKNGKNCIQLRQPLENSEDHEFYLKIKPISGNLQLKLGRDLPDNHLLCEGIELDKDIYLSIVYRNSFNVRNLLWIFLGLSFLVGIYCWLEKYAPLKNTRNSNGMDILRILSAYEVLALHLSNETGMLAEKTVLDIFVVTNDIALQSFMVLSGYLVYKSYDKAKNIFAFYKRRFMSLYPIYITMIMIMIVYFTFFVKHVPVDTSKLYWIRYFLCINTVVPSTDNFWVNLCATWMIPVFFLFYLLVPLYKKILTSEWKTLSFDYFASGAPELSKA